MKRTRIKTRRVALAVVYRMDRDTFGLVLPEADPWRPFFRGGFGLLSRVRTRVYASTGAPARVISLGPLSGNS